MQRLRGAKRSIDDNAASPSLSQTAQCDRTPKQKGDFIHFNPLSRHQLYARHSPEAGL
jgi:hypothetical protein